MDFAKDWDARDSALLAAAFSGIHNDIQSTKEILKRGGEEKNPLLGRHPSGQDLDKAALLSAAVSGGIAGLLPSSLRKPGLGALSGFEHGMAYKNRNVDSPKDAKFLSRNLEIPLALAALGGFAGHMLNKSDGSRTVSISPQDKEGVKIGLTQKFAKGGPVGFARASSVDRRNLTYRSPKGFARLKRGV